MVGAGSARRDRWQRETDPSGMVRAFLLLWMEAPDGRKGSPRFRMRMISPRTAQSTFCRRSKRTLAGAGAAPVTTDVRVVSAMRVGESRASAGHPPGRVLCQYASSTGPTSRSLRVPTTATQRPAASEVASAPRSRAQALTAPQIERSSARPMSPFGRRSGGRRPGSAARGAGRLSDAGPAPESFSTCGTSLGRDRPRGRF